MKRGQHLWLQIMFHCPTMQLDDNPNWLVCILDHFGHVNWLVWSQPVSAVCRWEERFSCEFVREAGVPSVSWSSLVCLPAAEDHWSWPGFKWFILDMFLLPQKKSVSKETHGLVLNHFGVPGVPYWGYLMSLLFKIWSPFWGFSSGNAMAPSQGVKKSRFPRGISKNRSRLGKEKQDDFGDHLAIPMLADESDEVSCFLPQTALWAETLCCWPHQSKKGGEEN